MDYEWETDSDMRELVDAYQDLIHGRLRVVGLIVENTETVEACAVMTAGEDMSDIERADVLKDATGDIMELYDQSVKQLRQTPPKMQ